MLTKFLDPKNDVAFRKIFGTEKNKEILIHFLNDIIDFTEDSPIEEVTFLKAVQDPEVKANKTSVVDILCQDQKGNRYIVEMQVAKEKGFEKRAQYYAAKAYCSQMADGGKYHTLKAIIFLAITDFTMFPHKKSFKSDHIILDKKSFENDLKDFSYTFLELPKFNKTIDQLTTMTDKWAYFFKHAGVTSPEELLKLEEEPIIARAYHELDRFYWSSDEIISYDQMEKYEGAYLASMEQKFDEGMAKGEAKGRAEGEAKGRAEGEAKGRAEGEAKGKREALFEMATLMIQRGDSSEEVRKLTALTEEEMTQVIRRCTAKSVG